MTNEQVRRRIADNVIRMRVEKGFNNRQKLADECGVSRQTFNDVENCKLLPRTETLQRLSEVFKCDISEFFRECQ